MKPKSRFHCHRPALALAITLVLSHLSQVHAADGTWSAYYSPYYDLSVPWSSSNWVDGIVADGEDSTAVFSNSSGNSSHKITLDSARTIGNLVFGNPNSGTKYWSLTGSSPASVLTLAVSAGSPTITVGGNTRAFIGAAISGTDGLTKTGAGSLNLSGTNTYSGVTSINEGMLQFDKAGSLYNSETANWTSENISVASGATLAVTVGSYWDSGINGLASAFSVAQAHALLSNLTTSINHNGLQAGSTFAIDTYGNSGVTTFDHVIADSTGAGGGALGFTKLGNYWDKLILNQANTYTGRTTVAGGILAISGSGTLGQNAALLVNPAGQLDLGGTTQTVGAVTITGESTNWRGSITNGNLVGASYEIAGGGAISAGLGGVGVNLSKTGAGTGLLSGANTYSGTTTVSAGTLQFAKSVSLYNGIESSWTKENVIVADGATLSVNVGGINDFTVAQSKTLLSNLTTSINNNGLQAGSSFALDTTNATGDTTFDQAIADSTGTGSGALGFTKLGNGKLILNQANSYTGPTTISGGSLAISGSGTLGNGAALVVNREASLNLGGSTQMVGAVIINGGLNSDSITNGNLIGTSYVVNHSGGNGNGWYADPGATTVAAGLGGAGASLNKTGSLTTVLSGTNTYSGATTVSAGTLKFAKTASLYNSDTASWTNENISVSSGATLAINVGGSGSFSVAQAKILLTNLTTSIDNNGLKEGSSFGIDTTNATGDTTFDQVIADPTGTGSGSLGFTKLGAGTLILNQANTYTGPTRISGTLKITGAGTLGNQGNLITYLGSNLDLGGSTQTVGAVQSGYGSMTNGNLIATSYDLRGGHHTAGLGGEGANLYVNDFFVYLEGVNTYTGTTTIDRTILGLKKSASLYNADMSKWTKENISAFGDGGMVVNIGGVGEFTTAQAKTLLSNLTTSIDHNGLTAGSSFGIDTSNASGPITFDQVIADSTGNGAGALGLWVEGAQALVLNQANTYSGNTRLIGGHLRVGHANAIPSGPGKGVVTTQEWTAGDSVLDLNGFDVSINALEGGGSKIVNNAVGTHKTLTLGSNDPAHSGNQFYGEIADNSGTGGTLALNKVGSGTQTLNGSNSYTGATTVSGGTLVVDGSISTSILTTVNATATLAGSGSVGALSIASGGTVAPGNSPGILNTGDLTIDGTFAAEINGATVGDLYDQINVTGSVTLSGLLALTTSGFTPAAGNLFFLIRNDGIDAVSGTFSGLAQGAEFDMAGKRWAISYNANSLGNAFGGGNDVGLMSIAIAGVPEPSTALLSGFGILALLRRRRRA